MQDSFQHFLQQFLPAALAHNNRSDLKKSIPLMFKNTLLKQKWDSKCVSTSVFVVLACFTESANCPRDSLSVRNELASDDTILGNTARDSFSFLPNFWLSAIVDCVGPDIFIVLNIICSSRWVCNRGHVK